MWAQPAFTLLMFAKKGACRLFAELPVCPAAHLSPLLSPVCRSWVYWQQLPRCCQLGTMCFCNRDPAMPHAANTKPMRWPPKPTYLRPINEHLFSTYGPAFEPSELAFSRLFKGWFRWVKTKHSTTSLPQTLPLKPGAPHQMPQC